jgi:hypothetical protein
MAKDSGAMWRDGAVHILFFRYGAHQARDGHEGDKYVTEVTLNNVIGNRGWKKKLQAVFSRQQ